MSIYLRWGAGGYSISPNLSCDRVVSSHSPVFQQLIHDTQVHLCITKGARLTRNVDILIRSIGQLYQDNKASAHDVDEKGNTIFHVSLLACHSAFCFTKIYTARKFCQIKTLSMEAMQRNSFA